MQGGFCGKWPRALTILKWRWLRYQLYHQSHLIDPPNKPNSRCGASSVAILASFRWILFLRVETLHWLVGAKVYTRGAAGLDGLQHNLTFVGKKLLELLLSAITGWNLQCFFNVPKSQIGKLWLWSTHFKHSTSSKPPPRGPWQVGVYLMSFSPFQNIPQPKHKTPFFGTLAIRSQCFLASESKRYFFSKRQVQRLLNGSFDGHKSSPWTCWSGYVIVSSV